MNDLNSVLLEGAVLGEGDYMQAESLEDSVYAFTILSVRHVKIGDVMQRQESHFDIETIGKLAENLKSWPLAAGAVVRVIGSLNEVRSTDRHGNALSVVTICAEHVEHKSKKKATV